MKRRDVHARIYAKLLRLIPDLALLRPGMARVSRSSGWMNLYLDVLAIEGEPGKTRWLRLSLAHYYQQNGDQVPDPDMELRVSLDPSWPMAEALNITQGGILFRAVYPQPGLVDVRAKRDLNSFLELWLRNALDQGHSLGTGTEA